MDFREAHHQLVSGYKIRRKLWDKSIYIKMNEEHHIKCYREEAFTFSYNLDIINSHDWIIIGYGNENLGVVCFHELIPFLLKGEKAKLPEWPDDTFIESTKNGKELFMRRICEYDFTPTFECFTSTDWEIIE